MDLSGATTRTHGSIQVPQTGPGAPLPFSSADFDSADAGSGDVISVRQGLDTAIQYHMNQAVSAVPDERDFVRSWRRRLRETLANKTDSLLAFLEKPATEWTGLRTRATFLKALDTPTFASNSKWMADNLASVVDLSGALTVLEADVGTPLDTLRSSLHEVLNLYQESIKQMFDLNETLSKNVSILDSLKDRLGHLSALGLDSPSTEALPALQTSILDYIGSCYDSLAIQPTYESFCKEYARFTALRSVLQSLHAGQDVTGGPVCSICMTDRITSVLVPCGHGFCNSCSQKQRNTCFLCRCTVRDRQRVYFS